MWKVDPKPEFSIQNAPNVTRPCTLEYRRSNVISGRRGAQSDLSPFGPLSGRPIHRLALVLLLSFLGTATNLAAQGQEPLLKADLVRLLTTRALSSEEIASLISRNCLAFEPTARDLEQFDNLGANDAIMSAIETCGTERLVQVAPLSARVAARAGGFAAVAVRVTRGGQPQPGIELALRGSGALPGGSGVDAHATSETDGEAAFWIPAGTISGNYQLTIVAAGPERVEGNTSILLVVTAGPAASADVGPEQLQIPHGAAGEAQLTVVIRDQYGNVVPGQEVEIRASSPAMGIADIARTTDARGEVTFAFDAGAVRESGRLAIVVGPDELASVPVSVLAGAAAAEQTQWVSGTSQSGAVGTTLPRPLVLLVRDASGLPIVGQQVALTAMNARVSPAAASTDSAGSVSVTVHLGNLVKPATITALVDGERIETAIQVVAGPAVDLILTSKGIPLRDDLVISSGGQVKLHIDAVDAYGNRAPVTDLQARIENQRVLRSLSVTSDSLGGRVVLQPLRDGVTSVTIEAAGLSERLVAQLVLSQRPYFPGYTELYGSGMIITPHAFIAPGRTDLFGIVGSSFPESNGSRSANEGASAVFSWRGRAEIGVAAYSIKDFGVPAKVQLLPPGPSGLSLALGVLNLIPTSDDIGRQGDTGYGAPYDNYLKKSSPYLVGSFARRAAGSPVGFLFSLGWGYGMFYVENPAYSDKGYTYGIFGAAAFDVEASPGVVFRLILEHDGWDTNAAGTVLFGGLDFTLGLLAIDEGSAEPDSGSLNQMRFFARVGASLDRTRAWLGF